MVSHLFFLTIFPKFLNSLSVEKRLTLHNVITHIKPVLHKDKNHTTARYFQEKNKKSSYQLAKK